MTTTPTDAPARHVCDRHDTKALRAVFSHFATGVTVVAAHGPGGPVGMTVNSFTSVSLDPPLVLVCLGNTSGTAGRIAAASSLAVSILGRHQESISAHFARGGGDRFVDVPAFAARTGAPVLDDCLAYLDCRTDRVITAGDHLVLIAEVVEAATLTRGEPLTFFRGTYR